MQRYVAAQLQYTTLWRLLEASERIDQLLEVVTPAEVPYQAGFSAADIRSLIASSMKDVGSGGGVGVKKTTGKPGDRERAEPSERDDPFTYRNTYHIITVYRAVTLRCSAAAEAEPRTDIERRRRSNSTNARTH